MITSKTNKQVKEICKLHLKKYRKNRYLTSDKALIDYAIKTKTIENLYYVKENPFSFKGEQVTEEVMEKMALGQAPYLALVKRTLDKEIKGDKVLLLDDIQDPKNLGTLIKACDLFNFGTIIISDNTTDLYHPKCIKEAGLSLNHINIIRDDLLKVIPLLKEQSYHICATGLRKNTKELGSLPKYSKVAIILGNEGSGVKEEIFKISEEVVKISMDNMDSLNVAIAGSIVLEHFN